MRCKYGAAKTTFLARQEKPLNDTAATGISRCLHADRVTGAAGRNEEARSALFAFSLEFHSHFTQTGGSTHEQTLCARMGLTVERSIEAGQLFWPNPRM